MAPQTFNLPSVALNSNAHRAPRPHPGQELCSQPHGHNQFRGDTDGRSRIPGIRPVQLLRRGLAWRTSLGDASVAFCAQVLQGPRPPLVLPVCPQPGWDTGRTVSTGQEPERVQDTPPPPIPSNSPSETPQHCGRHGRTQRQLRTVSAHRKEMRKRRHFAQERARCVGEPRAPRRAGSETGRPSLSKVSA